MKYGVTITRCGPALGYHQHQGAAALSHGQRFMNPLFLPVDRILELDRPRPQELGGSQR